MQKLTFVIALLPHLLPSQANSVSEPAIAHIARPTDLKMSKWNGAEMSQEDFMIKDTVLVLDEKDNVIGSESKKASHQFTPEQPTGVLHRAFSVFIFDESTNELLLQQRASEKITFPSVRRFRYVTN